MSYLRRAIEDLRSDPVAITQEALLHFCEDVLEHMEELGLNKKQLAAKAGIDPAAITRILTTSHNVELSTIGKLAAALDLRFRISLQELASHSSQSRIIEIGIHPPKGYPESGSFFEPQGEVEENVLEPSAA